VLYSGTVPANETQSLKIDAQGLVSGTYFVRLEGSDFFASETLSLLR